MKTLFRSLGIILTCALLLSSLPVCAKEETVLSADAVDDTVSVQEIPEFFEYRASVSDDSVTSDEIVLTAAGFTEKSDKMQTAIISDVNGGTDGEQRYLLTGDKGTVSWKFNVEESGWYCIKLRYYQVTEIGDFYGKTSSAQRTVYLDGVIPYSECQNTVFERIWRDDLEKSGEFHCNENGNQVRPSQVEAPQWVEKWFTDPDGFLSQPLQIFLTTGEHTFTLESVREPLLIDTVVFTGEAQVSSYQKPSSDISGSEIIIQGEAAALKSDQTLIPLSDTSSSGVEPYSLLNTVFNYIGGNNWSKNGQWIEWNFEVKTAGYYCIDIKFKQNQKRGLYSCRSLYIDGELPFAEAKAFNFPYAGNWQMKRLSDSENEPYLFYFEKGNHTVRLQNTLGSVSEIAQSVSQSAEVLSEVYRKVLMVVGNSPDTYRDYEIVKQFPELKNTFAEQAQILQQQLDALVDLVGEKSSLTSILSKVILQVKRLAEDPESISKKGNFDALKTNVGSLSSWVQSVAEQPLSIDYIRLCSPDMEEKKAEPGFFTRFLDNIKQIAVTYVKDYNSISGKNSDRTITVWYGSGRDQANVLKALIDDGFTEESGIGVDLKLIDPATVLMSAIMSGNAPDVAMGIAKSTPVNYALRGAVADISHFDGFDAVAGQFRESALTPYRFGDGVYALPETETYFMMFYRSDILAEMNLPVPQTWEDISNAVTVLQRYNLEVALPDPNTTSADLSYAMFLYQNSGSFYNEQGTATTIADDIGVSAFKKWTDYYTLMSFPVSYDAASRFRRGEIPIIITDYSFYNTLVASAPEISGKWSMAPVPGTLQTDGRIDRSVASNSTACIMLENSTKKKEAFRYMTWWVRDDTQLSYGREIESILGSAARYATANVSAQSKTAWSTEALESLQEQGKWVKGIPEIPGGYFTPRHLDNAFRYVTNNDANAQDALKDYVRYIDDEITQKRKEFALE